MFKKYFRFLTFLKMTEFKILKKVSEISGKIQCCDCHGLILKNIFKKVENIFFQKGQFYGIICFYDDTW